MRKRFKSWESPRQEKENCGGNDREIIFVIRVRILIRRNHDDCNAAQSVDHKTVGMGCQSTVGSTVCSTALRSTGSVHILSSTGNCLVQLVVQFCVVQALCIFCLAQETVGRQRQRQSIR